MAGANDRGAARALAAAAVADGAPTRWFEQLYAGAARGEHPVPWADLAPNPYLLSWPGRDPAAMRRTLVVGCGYGDDAEWLAARGHAVTAFDIAPSAVQHCRERFPASEVDYVVADLLDPPTWPSYDLVVEIYTLQVLPPGSPERRRAVTTLAALTGGTLLVICRLREPDEDVGQMPWPLTRADLAPLDRLVGPGSADVVVERDGEREVRRLRVAYSR